MSKDPWHFARPGLAAQYLQVLDVGLSSAKGLFARRRMGKTEFLQQDLVPAALTAGYSPVYVNLWEDSEHPGASVVDAIMRTVEPSGLEKLWAKFKRPVNKLKLSGKAMGFEGTLDVELAQAREKAASSALNDVLTQFDKSRKKLLLIIDEAQVLAQPMHSAFAHSLRASLDTRKARIKVIFAGSSETALRAMFAKPREPFYNWASVEPFELLGRDFVEALVQRANGKSKYPLKVADALAAFTALNNTPEFFRRYLERHLVNPEEGHAAAVAHTKTHVYADAGFASQWTALSSSDQEVLRLVANGAEDLLGGESRTQVGLELGLGTPVAASVIQNSLRRLTQRARVLSRVGHGEYQFEDEEFMRWIRERG